MPKRLRFFALASLIVVAGPAAAAASGNAVCIGFFTSRVGPSAVLDALALIGRRLFGGVASSNCDPDTD